MTQSMNMYHDLLLYSTDDSVWSIFNILNETPGPVLHKAKLLKLLAHGLKHCSSIDTGTTTGSSDISSGFCGMGMSL